jgi:hypothetical protein
MTQKFANAARAYLASSVSDSATTVVIDGGGSLFPAITSPDFSRAVLQDGNGIEVVLITAHTAASNSFTVTRGQEGTTARSFATGSVFGIRMTAADGDMFAAKQDALVSGTNIKTVNGSSLLGSGNVAVGDVTLAGTQTLTNKTINGTNNTVTGISLTAGVTGTLPLANGGTGETTRQAAMDTLAGAVTNGQYLRGNGTDVVMSAIQAADVPTLNQNTTGTAGNVTGTVVVANGGTGATSLTANNILLGNGTGTVNFVAPGTSGNVLTSNGTTWTSAVLPAGGLTYIFTTTAVTATDKQGVLTSTAGGAFTVTLPATPSVGAQVVIADAGNAWGTNNLTVDRNGSTIGGLAENLVCDITGASVQFVYDGTTWEVYAQIGGQGGSVVTLDGVQTLTNKTMDYNANTFTNFPAATPFSNNTSLAQVQATALSF